MLSMLQTGDKSGEVTARMNLSDLRLVVGLKSNSNLRSNIFRNINTNSSALSASFPGKSALLRKSPFSRIHLEHEALSQYTVNLCNSIFRSTLAKKHSCMTFMLFMHTLRAINLFFQSPEKAVNCNALLKVPVRFLTSSNAMKQFFWVGPSFICLVHTRGCTCTWHEGNVIHSPPNGVTWFHRSTRDCKVPRNTKRHQQRSLQASKHECKQSRV